MSGTDDNAKNLSGTDSKDNNQSNSDQSGTENYTAEIKELKEQIAELRKEAAKNRVNAKKSETEKLTVEEQLKSLQEDFAKAKTENKNVKLQAMLDKAGCIISKLVLKDMPNDLENPQEWIDKYKEENPFLFKTDSQNHGGSHKPSGNKQLTPSQQMDAYIRAALGR